MLLPNLVDVPLYRCIEDKNIIFIQKNVGLYITRYWYSIKQHAKSMLEKLVIIVGGQTHRYEAYRLPYA